jgi:hypothetical protein
MKQLRGSVSTNVLLTLLQISSLVRALPRPQDSIQITFASLPATQTPTSISGTQTNPDTQGASWELFKILFLPMQNINFFRRLFISALRQAERPRSYPSRRASFHLLPQPFERLQVYHLSKYHFRLSLPDYPLFVTGCRVPGSTSKFVWRDNSEHVNLDYLVINLDQHRDTHYRVGPARCFPTGSDGCHSRKYTISQ